MKVDVINIEGKKVSTVELPENIFNAPVNVSLMHQAYVRQMANARLGTHKTKGRSEVSGGGRKPWRQKGTGRARQGSTRAAQWVGGGKVHTPKPRNYEQKMPKKMRRAALRSALSVKANGDGLVVLDEWKLTQPKTKEMAKILNVLVGDSSALLLLPSRSDVNEVVSRCSRNMAVTKTLQADYLNIRDLLSYEKVVLPLQALEVIESYLS